MTTNPQENFYETEAEVIEEIIIPSENSDLIVIEQFPIIREQLHSIKAAAERDVAVALEMECTEENKQDIKRLRTSLSKQFTALEEKRKGVKKAILDPYNAFEEIYKECVTNIFKPADEQLKEKIAAVEDAQKEEKRQKALDYFNEYAASAEIDFIAFEDVGLTINLSTSDKKYKEEIKGFVDRICGDLALIDTQVHKEEILVEYKQSLNVSKAITTVSTRHRLIEEEQQRKEEAARREQEKAKATKAIDAIIAQEQAEQEAFFAPDTTDIPEEEQMSIPEAKPEPEQLYDVGPFKLKRVTKAQILKFKEFMKAEDMEYEQL